MAYTEGPSDKDAALLFTKDTLTDRAVRFGCGFILALSLLTSLIILGFGEPLGLSSVAVLGGLLAILSAVLSAAYGERVILGLLKLIKWLA